MPDSKSKRLSTEPYKGVRDFLPPEMAVQNHIFSIMRKTAESFGYVEYGASILEPSELYRPKTSEEIVNEQTYAFKDRGEREVTLRPEMTPTIARMIAAKQRELSFPLRWYSIPNVFRYERPQRGRLREHWQLNADIFGLAGIEAEIEIISLAHRIMKAFGAKDEDFEIRVNDRKQVQSELGKLLKDGKNTAEAIRLLDKRAKLDKKEFESEWKKLSDQPFTVWAGPLNEITAPLKMVGIPNVIFDPFLVRGFDYYTGMVFEVYDKNPKNNRSLFGGGRYDNLLEIFDEQPIPAVGFGMGDVTIRDFLETHGLLPAYASTTDIYLVRVDKKDAGQIEEIARRLRTLGLNVAIDLTDKKVGDQIKTADRQSIPYVLVIGDEELKTGKYKLKNLKTREEKECGLDDIAKIIKNR